MKVLTILIGVLIKTSSCGSPGGFGDLYANFIALSQVFFNSVNGIAYYITNDAYLYPEMTPSFISELKCKVRSYPIFLANATSRFSGVDQKVIYDILTGQPSTPIPSQLDSISDGLVAIRNHIDYLLNTVAVNMESLYKPPDTSNITSCSDVTNTLLRYYPSLSDLINERASKGSVDYNAYAALNLTDIYAYGLPRLQNCDINNIANGVSGLLGATNPENLNAYLNGSSTELDYPFSCGRAIFNLANQTINNAYTQFAIDGSIAYTTTTTTEAAASTTTETTTTTPTTTETTTATTIAVPPNTASCAKTVPLYDVTTGAYIKTACIVKTKLNFSSASAFCRTNGMYLLGIATNNDYLSMQQYLYPALVELGTNVLWINGVRDASGVWMYDSASGPKQLYSGVVPPGSYNNVELNVVGGSPRISILNTPGVFADPFICEYADSTPPIAATTSTTAATTTPTTTEVPTTTTTTAATTTAKKTATALPTPNPSICSRTKPLIDVTTSAYIKTACVVKTKKIFGDALTFCRNNGMNLLAIATNNDFLAIKQQLEASFNAISISDAWINGFYNEGGNWVYLTIPSGALPLYAGAVPSSGSDPYLSLQYDGISINTVTAPFGNLQSFVCEYVDSTKMQ